MLSLTVITGVCGGLKGNTRSVYFRCPECGTEYHDTKIEGDKYIATCDHPGKHATGASTRFEVECAPTPIGGTVTINRRDFVVDEAFSFLFNGCLEIDFSFNDSDGQFFNIQFGDVIEFSELAGKTISIPRISDEPTGNCDARPIFSLKGDFYCISSLHLHSIRYSDELNQLSLQLVFEGLNHDSGESVSVHSRLTALCRRVEPHDVLYRAGGFSVRFAKTYLPLLGLPAISENATRTEVVSVFGCPSHQGGGDHPICGRVPDWMRYTFAALYLHFMLEGDFITHVTIMARTGPFAASLPE